MLGSRSRLAWPMVPGPVFGRELGSAARGRWFYLLRGVTAALAGYVGLVVVFRDLHARGDNFSPAMIAQLATRALRSFEAAQFAVVLGLVPLLVAGSVAEEKARGTLGLILAGRLSSFEIVADKLAARLLVALVAFATGLPVLALIGLLGGIDPRELAIAFGLTLSAAWFAACLSMLVSVHARSAAGAVVGAYVVVFAWFAPTVWFADWLGTTGPPGLIDWLRPVARELARSSPLSILWARDIWGNAAFTPAGQVRAIWEMAGLQVGGGLVLLALAAWRLRPVYRLQVGGPRKQRRWLDRLTRLSGLKAARSKPPCGDDPMAWKERYSPESAWLANLALLVGVAVVARAIRLNFFVFPDHLLLAFDELFTYGMGVGVWATHGGYRNNLNHVLCEQAAILFGASLVASTVLAASGIAGERGRGTWSGLMATPLDRREILRAKIWGSVRPVRWLLALMLVFYLASMASTALHLVGFLLAVVAAATFLGSAVALGIWASSRSKNAGRAIGQTVVLLLVVYVAPVLALNPIVGEMPSTLAFPTVILALAPLSPMQFQLLIRGGAGGPSVGQFFGLYLGVVAGHAALAWWLTRSAARRLERDEG